MGLGRVSLVGTGMGREVYYGLYRLPPVSLNGKLKKKQTNPCFGWKLET